MVIAASSYTSPAMAIGIPTISESAPPSAQTANDMNKSLIQSVIPVGRKRKENSSVFQKNQKTKKQASQQHKMPSNVEIESCK